ncbi:RNA polymerase sigma factor [Bacteroidota bacterium]
MIGNSMISELLTEHQSLIKKICYNYCPIKEDREDLFQEIVFKVLKSYNNFKNLSRFSTWLYSLASNTAITMYQKKVKENKYYFEYLNNLSDGKDPYDESDIEKLNMAINCLNSNDRRIVSLYVEEKSYKEISDITGLSKQNISVKIYRIKKALQQNMTNSKAL